MLNKEQFLAAIDTEISIIKHLIQKIEATHLEYRPAENMRSTMELLQYLTFCGILPSKAAVEKNWDMAKSYMEKAAALTFEEIVPALDEQSKEMHLLLANVSEEQFQSEEITYPWGGTDKLGAGIVNMSLKFISAYKLQLFVYLKAAGLSDLNTMNAWLGQDPA